MQYIVVHNTHEGCYNFENIIDENNIVQTPIRINPPRLFCFSDKDTAQDFFNEYINGVDDLDIRCKKGDDIQHIEGCTCGTIEMSPERNPVLFYNRKNQIFFLNNGGQIFNSPILAKTEMNNINVIYKLMNKCKSLDHEQREQYIKLGRMCDHYKHNKHKPDFVQEEFDEEEFKDKKDN